LFVSKLKPHHILHLEKELKLQTQQDEIDQLKTKYLDIINRDHMVDSTQTDTQTLVNCCSTDSISNDTSSLSPRGR
jgi:hypothetical protein